MSDQKPQTMVALLNALIDAFDEAGPSTREEEEAELRALGLEPEVVSEQLEKVAEEALRRSPLNWRNRTPDIQNALDKRKSVQVADLSREEMLRELRSRQGLRAHFRNFEELTDEDLRSLLADEKYLDDDSDS